jgi:hypothetical protein
MAPQTAGDRAWEDVKSCIFGRITQALKLPRHSSSSGKETMRYGTLGKIILFLTHHLMTQAWVSTIFTSAIALSSPRMYFMQEKFVGFQDMKSSSPQSFGAFSLTSKVGVINDP